MWILEKHKLSYTFVDSTRGLLLLFVYSSQLYHRKVIDLHDYSANSFLCFKMKLIKLIEFI